MPKNINFITIIVTLAGIEKIKTEKKTAKQVVKLQSTCFVRLFSFFVLQENEDSGNRRPIMLETASSRDGLANSRRGEPESSVASGGVVGEKRSGEDANSQPSSQDRSSKNAKKDKQDSNTSGEFKRDSQ